MGYNVRGVLTKKYNITSTINKKRTTINNKRTIKGQQKQQKDNKNNIVFSYAIV